MEWKIRTEIREPGGKRRGNHGRLEKANGRELVESMSVISQRNADSVMKDGKREASSCGWGGVAATSGVDDR